MDVFLVPLGANRYALYCEAEPEPEPDPDDSAKPSSLWARAVRVFRRMLAEGEELRRRGPQALPNRGPIRRWIATRLASAVAEQRLLWHLRKESEAGLVRPDDLADADALRIARAELSRDYVKHLRWCVIDSLLATASIPVALIPGPNVLGYYFLFRAVGHLFSVLGARHGMKGVTWHLRATPHLTRLRVLVGRTSTDRAAELESIARALGLERLPHFFDRAATAD